MEKILSLLSSATWQLPAVAYNAAVCKINGQEVPCEEFWSMFKWLGAAGAGVALVFFLLGVLAFIFWLWMIVDCIKRQVSHKPVWILVLLLTGIIGAIIYYFAVKRSASKNLPTVGRVVG